MPLQADVTRPVRTFDTSGNIVNTESKSPIKQLDQVGREREVTSDAQQVAEAAANQNSELQKVPDGAKEEAPKEEASKEPEVTAADIRREYLEAQRAKRKAQEMEKKAKDSLSKAEAFEKAKALAENGEDPTAILRAAGLDPIKFYKDMTTYALSDKGKKEEDPVQRELREHKERLDKYAKGLEEQERKIQEKEELAAHNQVIAERVIPIIQNNTEKYEALLLQYGANAAVEVYKSVWEYYQDTGKTMSFEQAADALEKFWSDKIESGLNSASKLKKFTSRFAQSGSTQEDTSNTDHQETPKRSTTLSNKQSVSTPPVSKSTKRLTRDERVAEILKKFPDVK